MRYLISSSLPMGRPSPAESDTEDAAPSAESHDDDAPKTTADKDAHLRWEESFSQAKNFAHVLVFVAYVHGKPIVNVDSDYASELLGIQTTDLQGEVQILIQLNLIVKRVHGGEECFFAV